MIYLASPYTHPDPAVMTERYERVREFTVDKLLEGLAVFSPIVYGRAMEKQMGHTFKEWKTFNDAVLVRCNYVWLLQLPGWEESAGCQYELQLAVDHNIPVRFHQP